jgi:hypothetical protein
MDREFYAMLVVGFSEGVDRTSRAMFDERLAQLGWRKLTDAAWTLEFEPRSRVTRADTVALHLKLATEYARIEAGQRHAAVHFGDDEPARM